LSSVVYFVLCLDKPFGGKVLVLGGDFRQVLPVMPHSSREDIVSHSLKSHPLWRDGFVAVQRLSRNMRARADSAWRDYLLKIGDGIEKTHPAISPFAVRLPDAVVAPKDWTRVDLARAIFPGLQAASKRVASGSQEQDALQYFSDRALLAPTNAIVDETNAEILRTFDASMQHTYTSDDSIDAASPEEEANWPLDFLHSLTPSGMPPHELVLVPGALVMLLRNLDSDNGLVNGVRAIIMKCLPRVLDVMLVSGAKMGKRLYIPRVTLAPKNPDLPFVLRRRQFPVKLAWVMTFNKAQGQTLKRAGLYLPSPVFSHGQLYVGLSRAGSMERVTILVEDGPNQGRYEGVDGIGDGVYTDNVVWPEALLNNDDFDSAADVRVDADSSAPASDVRSDGATLLDGPSTASVASQATFPESAMSECWDALSGAPRTPPLQTCPPYSDDVMEFGTSHLQSSATNTYIASAVDGDPLDEDSDIETQAVFTNAAARSISFPDDIFWQDHFSCSSFSFLFPIVVYEFCFVFCRKLRRLLLHLAFAIQNGTRLRGVLEKMSSTSSRPSQRRHLQEARVPAVHKLTHALHRQLR
jgi:hypothetical protein